LNKNFKRILGSGHPIKLPLTLPGSVDNNTNLHGLSNDINKMVHCEESDKLIESHSVRSLEQEIIAEMIKGPKLLFNVLDSMKLNGIFCKPLLKGIPLSIFIFSEKSPCDIF
jgi:hypothetical protein